MAVLALAVISAACTKSPSQAATVPYPHSIEPAEVLANIKSEFGRQGLAHGMPEVSLAELRVRRILQVKSEKRLLPPEYLVVELEDSRGRPGTIFALTRGGVYMGSADCRQCPDDSRPLDRVDAAARVRNHVGGNPSRTEYVDFDNLAEGGVSLLLPLVAVTTERGVIYLNSKARKRSSRRAHHWSQSMAPGREPGRRLRRSGGSCARSGSGRPSNYPITQLPN